MALKVFTAFLISLLGVHVHGATLTATTTDVCTHGTGTIPIGGNVVLTCTSTATISAILAAVAGTASDATMVIKQNNVAAFTLSATTHADATGITIAGGSPYSATAAASGTNGWAVTITTAPADIHSVGTWTCEVTAGGDGNLAVAAEASANTLNLATFCTDFTAATYCGSGVQVLTCTTGALQLSAWSADATAQLNFRKGTTVKYTLSASNINTGVTSGNLDGTSTGTWSASATTATMVTFTPATAIATTDYGTDWSCDITKATGTYNGDSAALTINAACAAYTLSATCTGTTVSTLSIGTTGLDFATFAAGTSFTITVSKGTEERYKLTSTNVGTTATTGSLDAASAPIVAGTYAVSATTATTWTFTPTAAIAEADEGSDWRVVVVAGANGGGSGSVSVTCGAEMNKMAGMLVALLVAVKTLLF